MTRVRFVKADLQVEAPRPLRWNTVTVGWLPADGWFCSCGVARCEHVKEVKEVLSA